VYALAFGVGGIGLFAALAGERIPASAIPMLGIVAVTLFADLLIMRVLDDVRDSGYDRIANPQRPVASGAVALRDLSTLCALCVTVIVVANLSFPSGLVVLVVQLLYTGALMALGQRFPATRGDNLVLNLLVGFPVQLLLYVYLLAAFAKSSSGRNLSVAPQRANEATSIRLATTQRRCLRSVLGRLPSRCSPSLRLFRRSPGHSSRCLRW
jgi:hypothetical protein